MPNKQPYICIVQTLCRNLFTTIMSKIYYFQQIYLSLLVKKSVEKIFEKMKVRKRRQDSLEILRFGEEYIGRFQNEISEFLKFSGTEL